jgi:hypothetical protein
MDRPVTEIGRGWELDEEMSGREGGKNDSQ